MSRTLPSIEQLKRNAELARQMLGNGLIPYDTAMSTVKAYINATNVHSAKLAREYGIKHHPINPRAFLR